MAMASFTWTYNAETVQVVSSSLIALNRELRTRHFIVEGRSSLKMFATHCVTRELAPRGGFEPPTFRLKASRVILVKTCRNWA
jgi:hypothetical protein